MLETSPSRMTSNEPLIIYSSSHKFTRFLDNMKTSLSQLQILFMLFYSIILPAYYVQSSFVISVRKHVLHNDVSLLGQNLLNHDNQHNNDSNNLTNVDEDINDESNKDDHNNNIKRLEPCRFGYVGIIGAPNMGKSTLLNALLEEDLCIATNKPQTTRHAILGILTDHDQNVQLAFLDSPGVINDPAYKLQENMMDAVRGVFVDADVLCVVTDLYSTPIPSDALFQKLRDTDKPIIVCVNKVDLLGKAKENMDDGKTYSIEGAVARWRHYLPTAKLILPLSASTDLNINVLRTVLIGGNDIPAAIRSLGRPIPGMLPDGVRTIEDDEAISWIPESPGFLYSEDELSDRSERFFCSELIRASLFENLGKELPYCCEVRISQFREPRPGEKDVIRIGAEIVVERNSQKGIVIGTGGEKIKTVGVNARKRLQDFLRSKVHLDLSVKVDKDWRSNDERLKEYGYKK